MQTLSHTEPRAPRALPWIIAALTGIVAPMIALVMLADTSAPAQLIGPALAVALMGTGMIGAAADGRLSVGVGLALLTGAALIVIAHLLGLPAAPRPLATAAALLIASVSFAARGALFARSALDKGWWIAVFVVAGEAAVVATAFAAPGALPDWLLALLPAQWASVAVQMALTGGAAVTVSAHAVLIALLGTAAATLSVAYLWPRRWPYLIMFTTWLALSALVYHHQAKPAVYADMLASAQQAFASRSDMTLL